MKAKIQNLFEQINVTEHSASLLFKQVISMSAQIKSLSPSSLSFCDWDELFSLSCGCTIAGLILEKMVKVACTNRDREKILKRLGEIPEEYWPESIKNQVTYQPSRALGSIFAGVRYSPMRQNPHFFQVFHMLYFDYVERHSLSEISA